MKVDRDILLEETRRVLEENIEKYYKYLQIFDLIPENYSKSLQIELDEFSKKIRENEEIFTAIEKHKLIFWKPNESLIDEERLLHLSQSLQKLKSQLENFKIKLISLRKKAEKIRNDEDPMKVSLKDLEFVSNELTEFKSFPNENSAKKNVSEGEVTVK